MRSGQLKRIYRKMRFFCASTVVTCVAWLGTPESPRRCILTWSFLMRIKQTEANKSYTFLFLKFIYSEKATKFCKIFTLILSYVVPVKSKVKISQNFVTFSEYMNFTQLLCLIHNMRQQFKLLIYALKKDKLTKNQEKIVSSLE